MVITETKLDNTKSPSEFLPKNYEVPAHRNHSSHGGGVLIATKRGIVADEVPLKASENGEIVCTKIAIAKAIPLYICAFYRPPSDPTDSLSNLQSALEELAELTKNSPKSSVIVAGDFNARDIDWKMLAPTQECKKKGLCNDLITILGEAGLHQMQRECTRDDAILDLFCTNNPSAVKAIDTIPGISDHDGIILVDMHLKAQINKKKQRRIPLWSRANWEAIKAELLSFCGNFLKTCSARDASTNWDLFVMHIKEMQARHIPTKLTRSRFNLPWLSGEIKRMCRKKRRLYRRAQRSQNASHRAAFKQLQNKTRDALRKAHWSYVNGILTDGLEEGNLKPFYGYLKAQKQDSQGVSPLRDQGQLHSDAPTKAHILSDQFKSVFTSDEPDPNIRLQGREFPTISPLVIETPGVEKLLVSLNPRKASGPDEIPARILQALSSEIAPVLTTIFRQSIQSGNRPYQWKNAWITPVFKKGGRSVPSNYRPVSLTSISCKLLEHIYCTHLRRHIDQHNILGEANHGFQGQILHRDTTPYHHP